MKENPYGHLDESAFRIANLISGYIRKTLTEKEHIELDNWVTSSDHNMRLFEELTDEKNLAANLAWMDQVQSEKSLQQLQQSGTFKKQTNKFRLHPAWLAAASVILVAAIFFIYRVANKGKIGTDGIVISETAQILPGGNRATLTLDDGSVIDLTAQKNGLLKKVQGSDISKPVEGEIVYEEDGLVANTSVIHTLTTPVGGQYQVTLSDGTKVWLNAATTLKYPSRFSSGERKVELNGEAYFEVAKNEKLPFRVMLADSAGITVLGTHFNVMSYDNENAREITLLEGSVKVSRQAPVGKQQSVIIKPGQQAVISSPPRGGWEGALTTHDSLDTEEIIGWKNGQFVFHDAPIESVMRQVERWYDAKIVFQAKIKQQFNATIYRHEPLSKLLHLLELNGYVHFKVENKTVYVLP